VSPVVQGTAMLPVILPCEVHSQSSLFVYPLNPDIGLAPEHWMFVKSLIAGLVATLDSEDVNIVQTT